MVAVVFATGGLNGALACTDIGAAHGDIHIAAHEHGHDDHHAHDLDASAGDASSESGQMQSGLVDCDDCLHMHVHCCATSAMPASDYGLKLVFAHGMPLPEQGSLLPLGQLFYPLLRPPRAAA